MNVSDYVARRLLFEVCDIVTVLDDKFEPFFDDLWNWTEEFTQRFGGDLIHRLPSGSTSREMLLNDMSQLYEGIFSRMNDDHSITTLHSLFTVTFYMMMKYKDIGASMCSEIAFDFYLITRRLESWGFLEHFIRGRDT